MRNTEKHYENNTEEEECGDYVKEKKCAGGSYWINFSFITKANGKGILIWQMSVGITSNF